MTTNLFDITTPTFGGKPVRTVTGNGETWFCAMDVLTALDLTVRGVRQYLDGAGVKADEIRDFQNVVLEKRPGRPPLYINGTEDDANKGFIFTHIPCRPQPLRFSDFVATAA